jgi:hypothetical protein
MAKFSDLNRDVLSVILYHLPPEDLLASGLVSTLFKEAQGIATERIRRENSQENDITGLIGIKIHVAKFQGVMHGPAYLFYEYGPGQQDYYTIAYAEFHLDRLTYLNLKVAHINPYIMIRDHADIRITQYEDYFVAAEYDRGEVYVESEYPGKMTLNDIKESYDGDEEIIVISIKPEPRKITNYAHGVVKRITRNPPNICATYRGINPRNLLAIEEMTMYNSIIVKHGMTKIWYGNGQLKYYGKFRYGKAVGIHRKFGETGVMVWQHVYL